MTAHRRVPRAPLSFAAYLCEPDPTAGVGGLMRQRDAVERAAAALGGRITVWGVDSGRRFEGQRVGDAAMRLVSALKLGDILLVDDVTVFGADREVVAVVSNALAALGVVVIQATAAAAGAAAPRPRTGPGRRAAPRHVAPRLAAVAS